MQVSQKFYGAVMVDIMPLDMAVQSFPPFFECLKVLISKLHCFHMTESWFSVVEKEPVAYAFVEVIEAADMKPSDLNGWFKLKYPPVQDIAHI